MLFVILNTLDNYNKTVTNLIKIYNTQFICIQINEKVKFCDNKSRSIVIKKLFLRIFLGIYYKLFTLKTMF